MVCNRNPVTSPPPVTLEARDYYESMLIGKCMQDLEAHRSLIAFLRPVVKIQDLHAHTGVSRQKLADMLKARGYHFDVIRYEKQNHRVWIAPTCQHPKLELHRIIQEERRNASVSRS